jgi:pyridoxine 5-phosphate synthase
LSRELPVPLNLEMAATEEMLEIALRHKPHAACIVPEKREERTTEGGLDAVAGREHLEPYVRALGDAGIRVSLFVEPSLAQLDAARSLGVPAIELHTGAYCEAHGEARQREYARIVETARHAESVALECHAGHGLTFDNVGAVAAITSIVELNIGHFLVGEAIFCGLESSIRQMRVLMDKARSADVADQVVA